jgi:arginine deiminase
MTTLETATTVTAVLNTIPPAANAGKRVFEFFKNPELKKSREERDTAVEGLRLSQIQVSELQQELSAAKTEIEENVEAMDILADEVVAKQQEINDVTSVFEHYRDNTEIAYWAGGAVIIVLVIAIVYLAKQN